MRGVGQSLSPCTAIPVECTPTVLEKVSSEARVSVRHIFGTCKGKGRPSLSLSGLTRGISHIAGIFTLDFTRNLLEVTQSHTHTHTPLSYDKWIQ